MATLDMNSMVQATTKIKALTDAMNSATDPGVKAYLQAQISVETAALSANMAHAQAQADASANLLDVFGLMGTLTNVVGNQAPSIIALFRH